MADKGSSTAKISLVANFEQNNIKAMGKQLSDGIKTSLKDIKLDTVFDDADILGGVKKEIESIDGLLKNRTLNRLDFSSMIPPLAQALEDNSLSEQIRLQIVQGFREGLESGRTFLQGMPSGMTGDEIKAQFRQSAIMSDAVDSLPGLNKNQRSAFKKQWASITENDIRQLMATMDIADEYQDVLPYLLDVENLGKMVMENITSDKAGAPQKVVAAIARLQEMADKEGGEGKQSKLLDKLFSTQVQGGTVEQIYEDLLKSIPTLDDLYARVYDASVARDNARENIPKANATIENLLAKTLQRGYKNGSLQKMEPLYTGNYKTPAHITLSDLIEASNRETNTGGGEGAENAAERAENAAERAENASEEARAVAEDMKGTVEEGAAEASGTSKKGSTSKKKPSPQTSAEPAEQIADDAEADAENAEHVVDALDDKKARLESTIAELENKNRELQELNNKYQKAISDTFGEVKTPEEALALFKEKATQLQQADKDFADIVPQRNFTDPSNSEEIAILEEYEKRLAALQQALVEYQKAGETAMGKGVNPTDIRANQVDEERLQLNFADNTIDGYIKGLQRAIEDNKKKISEYENLLKTYRGQLEEFTRQGSPSDAKPSGGGQTQSRPAVDTAREETGEVRKSRQDLQAEREKLEAEIQNSAVTMSEAEKQINQINKDINRTGRRVKENEDIRLPAMKGFTQQAQQKKAELEEIEQELTNVSQERESLENQLQQITQVKKNKINAQKWLDYIDSFIGNDDLQELDRLQHIPFTEKGKPQKQKATDELKRIGQLYTEHRQGTGYHADQDNGVWKDAYTVLHYRAMEQAKKHQVADSTLSREQFDSDNEYFYQESLNKLKEEREFYRKIYEEEDKTIRQNQEQLERLQELQNREKELQNAKKQKTEELGVAQDNVAGLQEVESEIQTDKTRLTQLQQQRAEQQHIYNEAKAIQEEKQRQLAEIDRMIAEAESREQQPPSTTPATTQERDSTQTDDIYQKTLQEFEKTKTKLNRLKEERERIRNEVQEILTSALGEEHSSAIIRNEHSLQDYQKEIEEYKTQLQQLNQQQEELQTVIEEGYSTNGRRDARALLKQKKEDYENAWRAQENSLSQMTNPLEKSEASYNFDKAWIEYYKAFQEAQKKGVNEDWLKKQAIHEEDPMHFSKETYQDIVGHIQQSSEKYKQEIEKSISEQESLIEKAQNRLARLREKEQEVLSGSSEYQTLTGKKDQLDQEISQLQEALEQKRKLLKSIERGEVETGVNPETPLSSSGAETASGVQEEGNEAGDAAEKMQALAQAKKEALEANKQLAESANTTQKAIQNESDAGNFDELIAKLVEVAKLLAQLPQSFEGFKGFDLEPLKTLSEAIQQLPKEGLNISLGDSFNNLANSIDNVLNKVQELTSEAKIAEIEGNITQKYDEQIKQLKADAEEAKRVIEELKRTKQDAIRDEYDPGLDSSSEQYAPKEVGREIAARAKRNPDTDVDALIKEYGNLKRAQEKLFTIDSADEYSAALERREEILQRILELEQKIALSDVGQAQIDNLLMGYGEDASPSFSALDAARSAAQKSSVGRLSKNYTDQQKAEIKAMSDSLSSINIIPKDVQSNWSKKRREEYNQIAEGAQTASQAIETLNANLAAMEANGANPEVLKTFLQLKESTAQMIKDTQDKSNVFGESIEAASTELLDRLSNVETRLQVIKRDSGKLINVDPALAGALETIEKHLNKIQDLKNTVSNDPLQAINPQFTRSADSYLAQMEGKGKSKSVVEGLEQTSDRSQADFSRMTTNYGKYASALKKLFDDMSKGAGASLKNLEEDLARVDELATRLTGSTGLERNSLLTGELNSKAAPKVVDAQIEAASKASIAYESMLTKIESKAESAQSKISSIFGTDGITEGLKSNFVEGMAKGFDDFVNSANQAGTALQHLQEIQNNIKDDKTWLTQKENIIDYQQTMGTLESSLKEVTENAGNFKIVDDLDVQKLRASTTQFIKDNPALSGSDISQFNGYIDQLQGKINSVDFKNIENGIQRVKQNAIEAGRTGDTFMSMLTQRFKSLGAYLLSFVSFYEVIGVFKQGIGIIHELDDALTEMQKVSDESLSSLREYQKSTFDTANDIGTTAAQLQTSTADWMRLGETLQEASQSAQTANVLFNVSEFDNIDDATTALVAMSAAYADAEKDIDKMDIVDRLNLIGNNYAIATDELATALQDGAATLQTAGKQHCQNL